MILCEIQDLDVLDIDQEQIHFKCHVMGKDQSITYQERYHVKTGILFGSTKRHGCLINVTSNSTSADDENEEEEQHFQKYFRV